MQRAVESGTIVVGAVPLDGRRDSFPTDIPQVIAAPGLGFVEAVAMGSAALAVTFVVARASPRLEGARGAP